MFTKLFGKVVADALELDDRSFTNNNFMNHTAYTVSFAEQHFPIQHTRHVLSPLHIP